MVMTSEALEEDMEEEEGTISEVVMAAAEGVMT